MTDTYPLAKDTQAGNVPVCVRGWEIAAVCVTVGRRKCHGNTKLIRILGYPLITVTKVLKRF